MKNVITYLAMGSLLLATTSVAWGRGEEDFGNQPVGESNFTDWPGIVPVINSGPRVYRQWVNGNEHFYFRGDVEQLNEALRKLAKVEGPARELVLIPGTAHATSFQGREIPYDWNLHLIGGIARHLSKLEKGELLWPAHPVMTVYIGKDFPLEKLQIPEQVTVVRLAELKRRAIEALESRDKTVRGWGMGELAGMDRYDGRSVTIVSRMLDDDDNWVRLNAASSLGTFGAKARPFVDRLREAAEVENDDFKKAATHAIAEIEAAREDRDQEREHWAGLKAIDQFLNRRKGGN